MGVTTHGAEVSVIMPTEARRERVPLLWRALASVHNQERVRAVPIVVVNGPRADRALVDALARRSDVRLQVLSDADLPAALRVGRDLVDTELFAELDDDDLMLPGALACRIDALGTSPQADVVITNGLLRGRKGERLMHDLSRASADPLRALMLDNWLSPGGFLCRTAAVEAAFFAGMPRYLEWTYLALRLGAHRRLRFLDRPTFVHTIGAPFSLWGSPACILALPAALARILELDMPPELRACFEARFAAAVQQAEDLAPVGWRQALRGGQWRRLPLIRKLRHALWRRQTEPT